MFSSAVFRAFEVLIASSALSRFTSAKLGYKKIIITTVLSGQIRYDTRYLGSDLCFYSLFNKKALRKQCMRWKNTRFFILSQNFKSKCPNA